MTVPPDRLNHAEAWADRAEHDFAASEYLLGMGEDCPGDVVSFHAQQCAEKYLKALLVLCDVEFPRTHDLIRLLHLVPRTVGLALGPVDVSPLNRYAVEARYPGDWEPVSRSEAADALALARSVRSQVRARLAAARVGSTEEPPD